MKVKPLTRRQFGNMALGFGAAAIIASHGAAYTLGVATGAAADPSHATAATPIGFASGIFASVFFVAAAVCAAAWHAMKPRDQASDGAGAEAEAEVDEPAEP